MLTSNDLLSVGIKPFHRFKECLQCSSIEGALKIWKDFNSSKETKSSIKIIEGSVWAWFCFNECLSGMGSNSEKRRMIEQHCVEINRDTDWSPDEPMPHLITLRFFPNNNKARITML
jgi:hypothetical protein